MYGLPLLEGQALQEKTRAEYQMLVMREREMRRIAANTEEKNREDSNEGDKDSTGNDTSK